MIQVKGVSKSFGALEVLHQVSFEVGTGEVVGFLGPNGAGKTTLMRIITGFFPPTQGSVLIGGHDLFSGAKLLRSKIGYLPENNPLYRDMSVKSFLSYVAKLKGISARSRPSAIDEVIERCALGSVQGRLIGKLSKGFQQRTGLAQALLGNPEILILDEPTNGLDPQQIVEIRTLIQVIGKERTILLSSHILREVQMTCKRVLILNKGRLVASGTAEELSSQMRRAQDFLVTVRMDDEDEQKFFGNLPGVLAVKLERDSGGVKEYRIRAKHSDEARSAIAKAIVSAGYELLGLKSVDWNLEEIFMNIVTQEPMEVSR